MSLHQITEKYADVSYAIVAKIRKKYIYSIASISKETVDHNLFLTDMHVKLQIVLDLMIGDKTPKIVARKTRAKM